MDLHPLFNWAWGDLGIELAIFIFVPNIIVTALYLESERRVSNTLPLGACLDHTALQLLLYAQYIDFYAFPLILHNQMAPTAPHSLKTLPVNGTEMSTIKELLDGDLELKSVILRRQSEVQSRSSYAEKATRVFADCVKKTNAVKEAYTACIQSTKTLNEVLMNALNLNDDDKEVLATISSTKGILATWNETKTLAEAMLARLDRAAKEVETHLHLATDEQAAHDSTHIEGSESLVSCADLLRVVDRSIARKRGALSSLRRFPTEILLQIFMEAIEARQSEIINFLSSYFDFLSSPHDLNTLLTTLNLVPFILSATCKRWRAICETTPYLWRYARVPMIVSTLIGNKIIGKAQFERCILLAQKQPLELTVYPCYDVIHRGAAYPNLVLPPKVQILRVNIVWYNNYTIPLGVPSPVELCIVASSNSAGHYMQTLPSELLVNTKKLQCMEITPSFSNHPTGVQSLHIVLNKSGSLPQFNTLLQNCQQLQELCLEINTAQMIPDTFAFTHPQLHTLSLTSLALQWVISAFSAGCHLPLLARLVLIDINGSPSYWTGWNISHISGKFSRVTHIEVQAISAPGIEAEFLSLFNVATALRTTTLASSAVAPMLKLLTSSPPTRIDELILHDSDADGTMLRDYLVAIEEYNGGISGMKVVWNNCPNFDSEYGKASGELPL